MNSSVPRLLVIDDEDLICRAIKRALAAGFHVVTTTQPRVALQALLAGDSYDVILCDVSMADMTGMEFHAALGAVHPDKAQRIVFHTGNARLPEFQRYVAVCGNLVLEKPIASRVLIENIMNLIEPTRSAQLLSTAD